MKLVVGILSIYFICVHPCMSGTNLYGVGTHIHKDIGSYKSPSGSCIAELRVSDMGGAKSVRVLSSTGKILLDDKKDVNGIVWLNPSTLVYAVSPVYGKPGIFKYECYDHRLTPLVEPKNKNKYYPDSADYFELHSIANGTNAEVRFYYSDNVDSDDFREHIYRVHADGSAFMEVKKQ